MAPNTPPTAPQAAEQRRERAACQLDPLYFLDRHARVYDATLREWVPFRLWPPQVKATIDTEGNGSLVTPSDKTQPEPPFKRVYRAAHEGGSPWQALFLPCHAHPGRDAAWYARQRDDIFSRTGSLDDLHEQYPAT